MFLEPVCSLDTLSPLKLHHNPQGLSGLVGSELIEKMVDVNEQQAEVLDFLSATRRVWALHQKLQQV